MPMAVYEGSGTECQWVGDRNRGHTALYLFAFKYTVAPSFHETCSRLVLQYSSPSPVCSLLLPPCASCALNANQDLPSISLAVPFLPEHTPTLPWLYCSFLPEHTSTLPWPYTSLCLDVLSMPRPFPILQSSLNLLITFLDISPLYSHEDHCDGNHPQHQSQHFLRVHHFICSLHSGLLEPTLVYPVPGENGPISESMAY